MGPLDLLVSRTLPVLPRALVWRVARRYIAGEGLDDAARVLAGLKARGLRGTLDFLGEGVTSPAGADEARRTYCAALDRIHGDVLPAGISVKLSQLGLRIDPALARSNLESLVERAAGMGRFVRIDMEDSSTTEETIRIYRELRRTRSNLGLVLQAYLRRTEADARSLAGLGADVRVCKGIYAEPPSLAFQDREEVRRNFLKVIRILLEGGSRVAIATHDRWLIEESLKLTASLGAGPDRWEFQMLLGVAEPLWSSLIQEGRKLRIYVPFGSHWYPYSLRRLRENPRIAGYVFKDLLRAPFSRL